MSKFAWESEGEVTIEPPDDAEAPPETPTPARRPPDIDPVLKASKLILEKKRKT